MSDFRLYVRTRERDAARLLDLMSDALEEDGFAMATMEIDEKADLWEASIYVTTDEEPEIRARFGAIVTEALPDAQIETEKLPDVDWVARSLEGLKPVRAGRFVVHGSHDRHAVRPNDIGVEIDAGRAFGTGHHGTTAGCLEMMETVARRRSPRSVLDLGTGSGVLAIAIAKWLPTSVLATDIDPVAIEVARANAIRNAVRSDLTFAAAAGFHADVFARRGPFDLIVANILAGPLIRLAPEMTRHLAAGGDLILSGILAEQRWKVLAAYNGQGLAHRRTLWRDGWVTLHLS